MRASILLALALCTACALGAVRAERPALGRASAPFLWPQRFRSLAQLEAQQAPGGSSDTAASNGTRASLGGGAEPAPTQSPDCSLPKKADAQKLLEPADKADIIVSAGG